MTAIVDHADLEPSAGWPAAGPAEPVPSAGEAGDAVPPGAWFSVAGTGDAAVLSPEAFAQVDYRVDARGVFDLSPYRRQLFWSGSAPDEIVPALETEPDGHRDEKAADGHGGGAVPHRRSGTSTDRYRG